MRQSGFDAEEEQQEKKKNEQALRRQHSREPDALRPPANDPVRELLTEWHLRFNIKPYSRFWRLDLFSSVITPS
jgi:hypothetical protein